MPRQWRMQDKQTCHSLASGTNSSRRRRAYSSMAASITRAMNTDVNVAVCHVHCVRFSHQSVPLQSENQECMLQQVRAAPVGWTRC